MVHCLDTLILVRLDLWLMLGVFHQYTINRERNVSLIEEWLLVKINKQCRNRWGMISRWLGTQQSGDERRGKGLKEQESKEKLKNQEHAWVHLSFIKYASFYFLYIKNLPVLLFEWHVSGLTPEVLNKSLVSDLHQVTYV